jgi:oxygen-independent coproporphyrinogen-3 oxidase
MAFLLTDQYVSGLRWLMSTLAGYAADQEIDTVYLGGGTPSILSERHVASILSNLNRAFCLSPQAEITLEANPATLTLPKLKSYRASGVNRVSLGAQSFQPQELQTLGRLHQVRHIFTSLELINQAGIRNYSLDLMYGIPGQTLEAWHGSLEKALQTGVVHISLYLLQLEDHTPMGQAVKRRRLTLPGENLELNMYQSGINYLQANGLKQYELSNFAQPGWECRHNLTYWQAQRYLGLGASAVSFIGDQRLMFNTSLEQVLHKQQEIVVLETMTAEELAADALILGLRLTQGVELSCFQERFHIDVLAAYSREITRFQEAGLLEVSAGYLRLTQKGFFLSNQVFQCFV